MRPLPLVATIYLSSSTCCIITFVLSSEPTFAKLRPFENRISTWDQNHSFLHSTTDNRRSQITVREQTEQAERHLSRTLHTEEYSTDVAWLVDIKPSLHDSRNTTYRNGGVLVQRPPQHGGACADVLKMDFNGGHSQSYPSNPHEPSWTLTLRAGLGGPKECIKPDTLYEGMYLVNLDHFRASSCFNFQYVGRFVVHELKLGSDDETIVALAVDFECHCGSITALPVLFGWVRIDSDVPVSESLSMENWRTEQVRRQYARYLSMPGDMIGGYNHSFTELFQVELTFIGCTDNSGTPGAVKINLGSYDGFQVQFVAPVDSLFAVGQWYEDAILVNADDRSSTSLAGMDATGYERRCGAQLQGRFIIREFTLEDATNCNSALNKVHANLAVDFEQHCGELSSPPLFGWIRSNSNISIDYGMVDDWKKTTAAPTISKEPTRHPTGAPTAHPILPRPTKQPEPYPPHIPTGPTPHAPANRPSSSTSIEEYVPLWAIVVFGIFLFAMLGIPVGAVIACASPYNDMNKDPFLLTAAVMASVLGGIMGGILGGALLGPFVVSGYSLTRRICLVGRYNRRRNNDCYDRVVIGDDTAPRIEQELPPLVS